MKLWTSAFAIAMFGCHHGTPAPPADRVSTCDDVGAHGAQLHAPIGRSTPPSPVMGIMVQPPPEEDEGMSWREDCLDKQWPQAEIDCFVASATADDARACFTVASDEPAEDPACVAAADHGAEVLGNDSGADAAQRSQIRAAILEPCLEERYSDELLTCLSDPEWTEHFGICGFGMTGKPDWEAMKTSLDNAGYGPSKQP